MKHLPFLSPIVALVLSILFITTPLASAQTITTTSLPGITVSGTGRAAVPAETATVMISLGSDPYLYAEGPAMEKPPFDASAPIVTAEEIAAPVVDALVAAGLSVADIEIISNPYMGGYGPYGGPITVTILFDLADPTVERITGLLDPAIAAASEARLFINMTSVFYSVEDCAPLQRQAREAAIADARANAEMQAELLGVSLGDITAVHDNAAAGMYGYYGPSQVNSCTAGAGYDPVSVVYYGGVPFDPMLPVEVVVNAYLELTFEIVPGASATPAS